MSSLALSWLDTMGIEVGFLASRSYRHQKKGIGEALISAAEERLAALGCIKVNLQVVESNSVVVGFYQRAGIRSKSESV